MRAASQASFGRFASYPNSILHPDSLVPVSACLVLGSASRAQLLVRGELSLCAGGSPPGSVTAERKVTVTPLGVHLVPLSGQLREPGSVAPFRGASGEEWIRKQAPASRTRWLGSVETSASPQTKGTLVTGDDDDEGYEREHGGQVWPSAVCT